MVQLLDGYKSYLAAIGAGLTLTAVQAGLITADEGVKIGAAAAIAWGICMRLAIAKAQKKLDAVMQVTTAQSKLQ